MIRHIMLIAFMLMAWNANAAQVALRVPSNIGGSAGARVTAGAVTASNGSFSAGLTTQVAGKAVTVPATWRFASNAANYALGAIRLTPSGLVGGAVAAWLLGEGITYVNNKFMVDESTQTQEMPATSYPSNTHIIDATYGFKIFTVIYTSYSEACNAWRAGQAKTLGACTDNQTSYSNVQGTALGTCSYYQSTYPAGCQALSGPSRGNTCPSGYTAVNASVLQCKNLATVYQCPVGWTLSGSVCTQPLQNVEAVEADFAPLANQPLPDAVADELSAAKVPLPLQNPEVSPTPQTVPLTDPYVDPVTHDTVRDVATITPQPSNPETAIVDVNKQKVDPATGEPAIDPTTGEPVPPEEPTNFCEENPDALACWEAGTPDDSQLESKELGVSSISVIGFGGGGSCPAPVHIPKTNGYFSYQPICDFASGVKPLFLALAWIIAGMIVIGAAKGE